MGEHSHAEGHRSTASGDYSHAEGSRNTAIGQGSHAEGHRSTANGFYSHSEGSGKANGDYSHAEGGAIASGYASHAGGSGVSNNNFEWARSNSTLGQYGVVSVSTATTNNVATELFIDITNQRFSIGSGMTYFVNITVLCVDVYSGDSKEFRGNCLIKNVSGTTSLVGSSALASTYGDGSLSATTAVFSADNTNDALITTVTGLAATNIHWFCKYEYTQVRYII
jgi:hypothetical protein